MRLHRQRVLGLAQDLQQLIIGEEEEAGKCQALGLQVVRQTLRYTVSCHICTAASHAQSQIAAGLMHISVISVNIDAS